MNYPEFFDKIPTIKLKDELSDFLGAFENGEIILLLEARDDKLEVALGMEAEVQGPVENTVEGNQRIMTVEKIVFR